MRIVATAADVPEGKITSKGFTYTGSNLPGDPEAHLVVGPEVTVQNCPAPRVAVTSVNYAAQRKMYGGDSNTYAVGTVTAQPDRIGTRHLDDFTRDPVSPVVLPDLRIHEPSLPNEIPYPPGYRMDYPWLQ